MEGVSFILAMILFAAVCPLRAQDTAAWTDFQQKAAAWRALPVKPALSENVRRERVLAENAFREKQLSSAVDHYEAGLKMNPLWPEGQFNAALLYAELEDYNKAVWHMRAYLELVPDAPDAEGARDQLIIWQDKLTWIRQDSGHVDWNQAKTYCQNLRLGGYSGWRLPTIDELAAIYDPTQDSVLESLGESIHYHIKRGIKLSYPCIWSSSTSQDHGLVDAWFFCFSTGRRRPYALATGSYALTALCVRRSGE